jgi:hypothetical protein
MKHRLKPGPGPWRDCFGLGPGGIAGAAAGRCQQLEDRANAQPGLGGMPERAVGVDGIDSAAADPPAGQVPRRLCFAASRVTVAVSIKPSNLAAGRTLLA